MRFFRPFFPSAYLYPDALFRIQTEKKELCLTFDDGPNQTHTVQILEILDRHNVKAVFFCNGQAAEDNQAIVKNITDRGHMLGNHGYVHLDGWKCTTEKYIRNAERADDYTSQVLFRPPYGHMLPWQYNRLRQKYRIVMWDLMPYDFDSSFGIANTLTVLRQMMRPGSVIVMHDKPSSNAVFVLGSFLEHASGEGYRFVVPFNG